MPFARAAFCCIPLLVVLSAGAASGQTIWYVDAANCPGPGNGSQAHPFCKIQTAINAAAAHANPPDEIVVANGTYSGTGNKDLDFVGKTIKLRSANGPAACVIDLQLGGRGFYFHGGETAQAVVDGFTIRNGNVTGYTTGGGPYGGGVCIVSASPTLRNCIIEYNFVPGGLVGSGGSIPGLGGGIYCYASNSTLVNCIIRHNSGPSPISIGGGMSCTQNCNLTLRHCTIEANTIASSGGGIDCYNSHLVLTDCVIRGNNVTASDMTNGGGGIALLSTTASLTNCVISGNNVTPSAVYITPHGAGVYCSSASTTLVNCTITRNTFNMGGTSSASGGLYSEYCNPVLTNCILWGDAQPEIGRVSSNPVLTYCVVQSGWTGAGNLTTNPQFVDAVNGNFHLAANSPCIDTGNNAAVPAGVLTDIDGNPRILPGHPLHATLPQPGQPIPPPPPPVVDMGAYEFKLAPLPEPVEVPIGSSIVK